VSTRIPSLGGLFFWGMCSSFYCVYMESVTKWETLMTKQDQYGGIRRTYLCDDEEQRQRFRLLL